MLRFKFIQISESSTWSKPPIPRPIDLLDRITNWKHHRGYKFYRSSSPSPCDIAHSNHNAELPTEPESPAWSLIYFFFFFCFQYFQCGQTQIGAAGRIASAKRYAPLNPSDGLIQQALPARCLHTHIGLFAWSGVPITICWKLLRTGRGGGSHGVNLLILREDSWLLNWSY